MAENGDVAVTATAVRMIHYSRHTRRRQKNTPRSIVTPIVCPRLWAENGDVAVYYYSSMYVYYHTQEEEPKKHAAGRL